MGTISFTDMLENEKKLKELKNSIKENLNSILHNPNKKEITNIEEQYHKYKNLLETSFVDDKDEFFQKECNIKICSAKIKLGVSLDIEYLKKVVDNINWLNKSIGEFAEEEPQDANDLYDEIIVPNASIIYYKICELSYNTQEYNNIIKYAKDILWLNPYNVNIIKEYITQDNLSNLYLYLAEALFYNGDFDNAIKCYDNAIDTVPKSVEKYIKKAISLFKIKDYKNAEGIYYELLNPSNKFEVQDYKLQIYTNLCKMYIEVKNVAKAKEFLNKLKDILSDSSDNKNAILFLEARIYDIESDYQKAIIKYKQIVQNELQNSMNNIYLGTCLVKSGNADGYNFIKKGISAQLSELSVNNIPSSLYMYRPINERTIAVIYDQYLTFSEPRDFNDPLDSRYCLEQVQEKEIKKVLSDIKIRCFSSGENAEPLNTLMWAHYAENHTGVAIEYEFLPDFMNRINKEFFFNSVKYSQTLIHNMHLIEFKDYVKAFFTKDPYWQYENEYRLLTFKDKLENGYKLNNCIKLKSITFGYKTSNEYKKLIKNIVTNKDCLLYEIIIPDMQIAPFKLKRQLINI